MRHSHNLEAERSLLGTVLLWNEVFAQVVPFLEMRDFYRDAHGRIFDAMLTLAASGTVIDLVTVKDTLQATGALDAAGGPAYIASLVDGLPRRGLVRVYVRVIRYHAAVRRGEAPPEALTTLLGETGWS